ncbi:MAG TPA: hypothetical protein VHS27_09030 [Gaiellales bacterium]|nr:hypothetical protein [Gaiellales bacterium]
MTSTAAPDLEAGLSEVVREANREVYLFAVDGGAGLDEELELGCACGRPDCGEHVLITVEVYLSVHATTDRFVVSPGHADRRLAVVVDRGRVYEVVRVIRGARTSF